jgi:hypothetical protein
MAGLVAEVFNVEVSWQGRAQKVDHSRQGGRPAAVHSNDDYGGSAGHYISTDICLLGGRM